MKDYSPGIIRTLQMGGSDVENFLSPRLEQVAFSSQNGVEMGPKKRHGVHPFAPQDYYAMCEYLECDVWLNLPGTVSKEGILKFMEYLGAPADTGYGKVRAEAGHPEPWTKTMTGIHVEFGNEIWNFAKPYYGCGYNGADYWHDLIEAGKNSPWYSSNIIFNVGGRGFPGMGKVPDLVPNADRYSWAPYILHRVTKEHAEALDTDEKLLQWAFTRAIDNATGNGEMVQAQKMANGRAPLSIYEINHHLQQGALPMARINKIQATLGGGINVGNAMLMHLKYNGAVDQCMFTYGSAATDLDKKPSVWGTVYDDRYHPLFLACALANRALGGTLLETTQTGDNPVFTGYGYKKAEPVPGQPILWSYAFKDGAKRSVILVSLDLTQEQTVKLDFSGSVKDKTARTLLLSSESFLDHNAAEEIVKTTEGTFEKFQSGSVITLPPCSMMALIWEEK